MRYAMLIYVDPDAERTETPAPDAYPDWVTYTEALKASGCLVGAERLEETDTSTSVRVRSGDRMLTDGPFAETKEHLLGFYLVEVPDIDTALDWAARMPMTHVGTVELRPVRLGDPWRKVLGDV